ncbi:MAG: hypothetical protein ACI9QC_000646 [Oceanicoccus sp.]|jgi:hypothetical protein
MPKTKKQIKVKIRVPHVTLDARNADPEMVSKLTEGLDALDARFRLLGPKIKGVDLAYAFSVEEALEESHMWVVLGGAMPSEFNMIVERGIVPIALRGMNKDLENYNAVSESGNAFLFPKSSTWSIYGTMVRALENFNFIYDWKNLESEVKSLTD